MFRRFKNPYLTQKWPKEKFEFSANQSSVFNFRISMTSTFWFGLRTCSQVFFILFILFTPHFLVFIYESMRITDSWAQSRDLSTDKQNRVYLCVNQSTSSDFSDKKKNFNHDLRNGPKFSFLTVCQFPDLPIDFCECRSHLCLAFYHILMEIYSKIGLVRPFSSGPKFSFIGCLHWQGFWWRHRYDSWLLSN